MNPWSLWTPQILCTLSLLKYHMLEKHCDKGLVTSLQNHKHNIMRTCSEGRVCSNNEHEFCS